MNVDEAIRKARDTGQPVEVTVPFPGSGRIGDFTDPEGRVGPLPLDENPVVAAARAKQRATEADEPR